MLLNEKFTQELPQVDVLFAGGNFRARLCLLVHRGATWKKAREADI